MASHAVRQFYPRDERPRISCACGWAYKHRDTLAKTVAENTLLDEFNVHMQRVAARAANAFDAKG